MLRGIKLRAIHDSRQPTPQDHLEHVASAGRRSIRGSFICPNKLRLARQAESETLEQRAQEVIEWIKTKGGKATSDELQKGLRNSVNQVREVMALLVEQGRCEILRINHNDKPSEWKLVDSAQ